MNRNSLNGAGSVDVQFEAECVVLIEGEILNGCEIIQIHTNAITAKHEYASIGLNKEAGGKISEILRPGQIIPVVVGKVRYNINQPHISMIGKPYIPTSPSKPIYYNIIKKIDDREKKLLEVLFNRIKEEEDAHKDLKTNPMYKFFQDILYPFRTDQKYDRSKKALTVGLNQFLSN